jgi:hypothetical protein
MFFQTSYKKFELATSMFYHHAYNFSTQEAEAGRSRVLGQPVLDN